LILIALAWGAISGGLEQLPRSRTAGQKIETLVQIMCGLLSLLTVLTCFWRRKWSYAVHTAWAVSLAAAAGLSAFVWGPPMLLVAVLFIAGALLFALIILWALRKFSWNDYYAAKHQD